MSRIGYKASRHTPPVYLSKNFVVVFYGGTHRVVTCLVELRRDRVTGAGQRSLGPLRSLFSRGTGGKNSGPEISLTLSASIV